MRDRTSLKEGGGERGGDTKYSYCQGSVLSQQIDSIDNNNKLNTR